MSHLVEVIRHDVPHYWPGRQIDIRVLLGHNQIIV